VINQLKAHVMTVKINARMGEDVYQARDTIFVCARRVLVEIDVKTH
jgi:hypothetical protein